MKSRKLLVAAMVLLLGSIVLGSQAEADKTVKLTTGAALRARPGERAPTITKLASGQTVRIVAEKGRWLQVSVGGRVGWITRTQAELEEETEVVSRGKAKKGERVPGGKRDKEKAWDALDEGSVGGDVVAASEEEEAAAAPKVEVEEEEAAPRAKKLTKKEKRELAKQEKAERDREAREARAAERARKEKEREEVEAAAAAAPAEEPGFAEGQLVVVKRTTSVRKKPSPKSAELYEAAKGDKGTVLLVDEDGAWVRVEDEEGTKGWIAAADLGGPAAAPAPAKRKVEPPKPVAVAVAEEESEEEEEAPLPKKKKAAKVVEAEDDGDAKELAGKEEDTGVPGADKPKRFTWFISAGAGFLSRTQRFTSGGTGVRANYGINNSAPAIQAGGQAIARFGKIGVGVEGWYLRSIGGSGIAIDDGTNMGTLGYRTVAMDARLLAGYDLAGFFIHGRAGYHRDSTYVTFDDFAMLPDEKVGGLTVGGGISAPHITSRLGAHVQAEMLLGGKLTQDMGARDGSETKSVAYYLSGGATFQVLKGLEASASYALTMAGFGFAGPSDRDSDAIDGRRKDRQHLVTVGARYSF